jgi:WD40 repeat protein
MRTVPAEPVKPDPKAKVIAFPAQPMADVTGHEGFVTAVEFHPTREMAISADSWGVIQAWPYLGTDPKPIWSLKDAHDGWIRELKISPNGEWFATCGIDRWARIRNTNDGSLLGETRHHADDVYALAIHPGGDLIVTADLKARVILQETRSGKIVREWSPEKFYVRNREQDLGGVRKLAFTADGKQLLVAGTLPTGGGFFNGHAHIRMFDVETGKETHDLVIGDEKKDILVHDLHVRPDGLICAVTCGQPGGGNLMLRYPHEDQPRLMHAKGTVNCHSLAVMKDGSRIAVAATNTGSNGNGKPVDADGNYLGNHSPIHIFEMTPALA